MPRYLNKCILLAIEIRTNISTYRRQNLNIVDTKWLDVQVKRNSKKKFPESSERVQIICIEADIHYAEHIIRYIARTVIIIRTPTLYQPCATLKIRRQILFHFQHRINVISTLIHNIETTLIQRWNVGWEIYARKYVLQKCISKTKYRWQKSKIRKLKLKVSINTRVK